MGRKIKVIVLSSGQILATVMTLLTTMIFSRVLTKSDLATYRQTMIAYDFLTPILILGIPSAIYYFLTGEKENKKSIILESVIILLVTGCIFSLFLLLGGNYFLAKILKNEELSKTLKWLSLYPIYTFPALVLIPILIINEKIKQATIFNILTNIILSFLLITSSYYTKKYQLPLILKIIFPVLSFPILFYMVWRSIPEKKVKIRLERMKEMIKFGFPLGISSTLALLSVQLDKIIVSSFSTPEDFAIYSNGAIEIPLIGIITGAIGTVIMVDMKKYFMENKKEDALLLYKNSAVKSALILFPAMCFLFVFGSEFIQILFSDKYIKSVVPFRIYLLLLPIRIMSYGNVLTILGKSKAILLRGVGDLGVNLILSIIFVKYFGIYGAAWATVFTIYLWHVPFNLKAISNGFNTKLKNMIFTKKLFKIFTISCMSSGIASLIFFLNINIVKTFIIGGIIFSSFYLAISFYFIDEFKEFMKTIFLKIKNR